MMGAKSSPYFKRQQSDRAPEDVTVVFESTKSVGIKGHNDDNSEVDQAEYDPKGNTILIE